MKQAYIAGRYTDEDPAKIRQHVSMALQAASLAACKGWFPICPHAMGPHRDVTWEDAMTRCRDLVQNLDPNRDILVALPNWAESRGAREEIGLAMSLGIRVVALAEL